MVIYIKRLLLFLCFFFLFNTLEIDSNSEKNLLYDKNKLYEENDYNIYFKNINSKKLESILNILNIEVLCYYIDDIKYYARDIRELTNIYLKDKSEEEKIYYSEYGFNIDGIHVLCINDELIKLENMVSIY